MRDFSKIYDQAAERKGGMDTLATLLPPIMDETELLAIPNDRILSQMTKCIFKAGFIWRVIENKWPEFEQAFLNFDPHKLCFEPDEFWEKLSSDERIVRHGQKIIAVRHNARFVLDISDQHGSFARFLKDWPSDDIAGLWAFLAKNGKRLGGMTGRYFLRFIGKDCIIPSSDVTKALRSFGLEIAENPTSKRDLAKIQTQFNHWHQETGLSYTHLSRICAMSIGENYDVDTIQKNSGTGDDG